MVLVAPVKKMDGLQEARAFPQDRMQPPGKAMQVKPLTAPWNFSRKLELGYFYHNPQRR